MTTSDKPAPPVGSTEWYEAMGEEVERNPIGGHLRPAPAPLRDAREVAEQFIRAMGRSLGCDFWEIESQVGKLEEAILADRAARQPDVARLRELLEEGARLVETKATELPPYFSAWARRAREAWK